MDVVQITSKPERIYRFSYPRVCKWCKKEFQTWNRAQLYCCLECRWANEHHKPRKEPGHWLNVPIVCGTCGKEFYRTIKTGPNKKYCSPECSIRARRSDFLKFAELNPGSMEAYNRQRAKNHGPDLLMTRLRKKYPDLPRSCEVIGCSEDRVLDLAHRPEFARRGKHRVMAHYERHMFWVLCPNHHRLIDDHFCTPEELGLSIYLVECGWILAE